MGKNLLNLGISNGFTEITANMQSNKKIDKLDFIKIENLCFKSNYQESENTIRRMKENICKPRI